MLPSSLLSLVESHGCFSGCYDFHSDVMAIVDPNRPAKAMFQVQCEDCLSFHVGALRSHLPGIKYGSHLATQLTEHMRQLRGYAWSVGGYHVSARIWLSAAYFPCGVVLISGERNPQHNDDLACLITGFKHGVVQATDPAMLQSANYRVHTAYLDMSKPIAPVRDIGDILTSPQCSTNYRQGYHRVTVAEFLPVAQAATSALAGGTASMSSTPLPSSGQANSPATPQPNDPPITLESEPMVIGDICPRCGGEFKERPSLTKTFIGCLC